MDIRPARQLWLPIEIQGGLFTSKAETVSPVEDEQVMEQVVERGNLLTALGNVRRNGGSPGIDGMTVEELPEYLKSKWPEIRCQLTSGRYVPLPVKRVEIHKPGGGIRQPGIPTVLDRFIQQALLQVLQQDWDATFSESSYGFRPRRDVYGLKSKRAGLMVLKSISGRRIEVIVKELRRYMLGRQAYFNITQVRYILRELDSWVKRRLWCCLWKQWGRRGYRELRKLGVSIDLAWNTAKSAHGPWRLNRGAVVRDPYARWCWRRGAARLLPIPIVGATIDHHSC